MRVVEQLIQHFWTRGALSRTEADYLVLHGFVRSHELQDYNLDNDNPVEPTPLYEPPEVREPAPPPPDIEDVLLGRRTGRKKQGGKKKPKPSGHNLAPLETRLHDHFKSRQGYPALMNLGSQIRPCSDWTDAATAVSEVTATDLEIHLVSVLSHRPQALGELWFSFSVEDLYTWSMGPSPESTGPVVTALRDLLRADVPTQVGRIDQLRKAEGMNTLLEVLAARRVFLDTLGGLYRRHFARLARWLAPPSGLAAAIWTALPLAYVIVYNGSTPEPDKAAIPDSMYMLAWETAWRMQSLPLLASLQDTRRPQELICPLDWRIE